MKMPAWRELFGRTRREAVKDAREALREAAARIEQFATEHQGGEREREQLPDEAFEQGEGEEHRP